MNYVDTQYTQIIITHHTYIYIYIYTIYRHNIYTIGETEQDAEVGETDL